MRMKTVSYFCNPSLFPTPTYCQCAEPGAGQKEEDASRSLFILIVLLIIALFLSYILQTRRIQAVHETVISILAGALKLKQIVKSKLTPFGRLIRRIDIAPDCEPRHS